MEQPINQDFLRYQAQTSPYPLGMEVAYAKGSYIYDRNQKPYLDFVAGVSACALGHQHPRVNDAIKKQLDSYSHVMVYGEYAQGPAVEYCKLLAQLLPEPLNKVYLVNSGTEACEGALKLARRVTGRKQLISCYNAYHGNTMGAMSVIPDTATLVGTVRTFSPAVQALVERRLSELCGAVAMGFGATATVQYERMYPATINSAPEAHFAADVATSLLGREHVVRDLEPSMGSEDFSFMLQVKPGAYFRIGQGEENGVGSCFLHNSRYDFNDEILPLGAALHASLVEHAMPLPA